MSLSTIRSALSPRCRISLLAAPGLSSVYPQTTTVLGGARFYAKKSKDSKAPKAKETNTGTKNTFSSAGLVPGSQKAVSDAAAPEYAKADEKMHTAVEWFRKECAALESRASGRVTPTLLAPVRVKLKGDESGGVRLEDVATVGVKDGSMLIVTLFDDASYKAVEDALLMSKIPNVVPQKQDARTIRIPIPKPTVEARNALSTQAQRQAEDTRTQIRKQHQASLKKAKPEKRSPDIDAFQKLTDKHIADVDKFWLT